ncbi:MAG: hypothetical protein GX568_03015 [Candidatus Gastranaerophilales bacterium]|nr:hypothetical protein [Candidatus Gastranaerophilales bacterium]
MQYPVGKTLVNEFSKAAQKRGYDQDLKQGYIEERKELYRKTAPINDVAVGGAALATAGAVGYKAIKGKSFKNAVGQQFKPVIDAAKQLAQKSKILRAERKEAQTVSKYLKTIGKSTANNVKGAAKVILGAAKSVPIAAVIPAVALIGIAAGKSLLRTTEINAKYDTLQTIRDALQ